MTIRYYEETPCHWGFWHNDTTHHDVEGFAFDDLCPGGQRRELSDVDVVGYGRWAMKGLAVTVSDHRRYAIIPLVDLPTEEER